MDWGDYLKKGRIHLLIIGAALLNGCISTNGKDYDIRDVMGFTRPDDNMVFFYNGQDLEHLFDNNEYGTYWWFKSPKKDPIGDQGPVVTAEYDPTLFNRMQKAVVTLEYEGQRLSEEYEIMILDQNAPVIELSLPEKIDSETSLQELFNVTDLPDWNGSPENLPFTESVSGDAYTRPGWTAQVTTYSSVTNVPTSYDTGKVMDVAVVSSETGLYQPIELKVMAWDGHGNFTKNEFEIDLNQLPVQKD